MQAEGKEKSGLFGFLDWNCTTDLGKKCIIYIALFKLMLEKQEILSAYGSTHGS